MTKMLRATVLIFPLLVGCSGDIGHPGESGGKAASSSKLRFEYLVPEAGSLRMPGGGLGQGFVDLRDGTHWICSYEQCISDGKYPLEQTEKLSESQEEPASSNLITRDSVGPVRLGMSIAQTRKVMPGKEFRRTTDGEGVALVEVVDGQDAVIILYAGEGDAEAPIDDGAIIEWIYACDSRYATAEGVSPGMSLRKAEDVYGKVSISMSEIESREYAEFRDAPEGLTFRVGTTEEHNFVAAGIYPEGERTAKAYVPEAVILSIMIAS